MRHAPETIVGKLTEAEAPKSVANQDWNLGCQDSHQHIDEEWDGRDYREQPEQDECPTHRLNDPDKRPHHLRAGNANPGKPARADFVRKEKFLDAFGKED